MNELQALKIVANMPPDAVPYDNITIDVRELIEEKIELLHVMFKKNEDKTKWVYNGFYRDTNLR